MNRNERAKMLEKKKLFIGNKQKQKFQFISESDEFVSLSMAMGDLVMTWCVCVRERECICCDEQLTNIITAYPIFHMQQYSFCYLFSRECARVRFRSHEFKYIAHYVANMRIIIVLIIFVDVI